MSLALQADGLVKRYGRGCDVCLDSTGADANSNICPECGAVVALNRVSLSLIRGEILGIMGESGSGKSTLLRLLFFQESPDDGRARFHNDEEWIDLFELNPAQARELRDRSFGIVHQNPWMGLRFDVSAGGNIAERLLMAGGRHFSVIREKASKLLERAAVPVRRMDESPRGFSGGMQQRVQIAKALATEPALLFLDEITSGLDLSVQARILDLVLELHQALKISMLVVTHDIGVIKLLASQTLIMRHGQIVEQGLTDQILQDPQHGYTQELISAAL